MTVDIPDTILDAFASALAKRLGAPGDGSGPETPWMTTKEAIVYSRIPEGTFRQLAAEGSIPSHGGRSKVFHRDEVDAAIRRHDRRAAARRNRKST